MEELLALLSIEQLDSLTALLPLAVKISAIVGAVFLAIKPITVFTPTKIDDKIYGIFGKVYNLVQKVLNLLVLNLGKDKNADDK